jgi:hypothetical protein
MNLSLIAAVDTFHLLRFLVPLIVVVLGLRVGRLILIGVSLKKRAELLGALESEAPEFWQALGAPSFTLWQQLLRRRDPFANDRLWFYALWRADIFPDQPRVRAALLAYRRVESIDLAYTALVLVVAGLLFIFMRR